MFRQWLHRPYLFGAMIILLGAGLVWITQPKRDDCDRFEEAFHTRFQNELYGQRMGSTMLPAIGVGAMKFCREHNNAGACLRLVELARALVIELYRYPERCLFKRAEDKVLYSFFSEWFKLWIAIAWDDFTPELGEFCHGQCWFQTEDFALFCQMKKVFIYLYGEELWQQQEPLWLKDLFHDAAQWSEQKDCINCESRRKATEVIGFKESRKRSLLGLSCSSF